MRTETRRRRRFHHDELGQSGGRLPPMMTRLRWREASRRRAEVSSGQGGRRLRRPKAILWEREALRLVDAQGRGWGLARSRRGLLAVWRRGSWKNKAPSMAPRTSGPAEIAKLADGRLRSWGMTRGDGRGPHAAIAFTGFAPEDERFPTTIAKRVSAGISSRIRWRDVEAAHVRSRSRAFVGTLRSTAPDERCRPGPRLIPRDAHVAERLGQRRGIVDGGVEERVPLVGLVIVSLFSCFLLLFSRVAQTAGSDASRLSQCFVDTVLNKQGKLDPDALSVLHDTSMTENCLHLRLGSTLGVRAKNSKTLLLFEGVVARGLPLHNLRYARLGLRRLSSELPWRMR